ncbi:MAG TPA: iron chelate uptake ABC transporter family permease subunit [archaeon]|nr:iron chelate uptake ABC transporter family permease subunit [archaeon]
MTEMILFMAAPFTACILLLGICGYFGMHVLRREIIFIDIAMAQIATLGTTTAFLLRLDPHSASATLFSVGAISVAAATFAFTRYGCRTVPLEAVIGVTYAAATMAAVILIDKAAGGHEHIREMLSGSILWVSWKAVGISSVIFALVGLLHILFRNKFSFLSRDYEEARKSGMRVRGWDFLFYLSFGLSMIPAVSIGGILLVFAFLIIPATISALMARSWAARMAIAWIIGAAVSMLGLVLSWKLDLQSGPTVVCILGIVLAAAVSWRKIAFSNTANSITRTE